MAEQAGYSENSDHTPDPTAMTGTLETSGTGGGAHERLGGNVAAFQDAGEISRRVEKLVAEKMEALREELYAQVAKDLAEQAQAGTVEENGLQTNPGPVVSGDDTGAPADTSTTEETVTEDGGEAEGEDPSGDYVKQVTEAVEGVVKPSTARKTTSRRQSTKK